MNLIERIDEARTRWNVLDHPFYRRWERGELSRDELAFYAGEYRHAVVALADAAATAGDPEHAAEEAAHIELWDDFAAALDAPLDHEPTAETRDCAKAWRRADPLESRAVLYAVESGQPDISRTKLTGLVDNYGFEAGKATAYFELHAERDHEHAAQSRTALEATSAEDADRLVAAAEAALQGNWRLLDAVEMRARGLEPLRS
jgi:pyrroloquinoline-quinone synthase